MSGLRFRISGSAHRSTSHNEEKDEEPRAMPLQRYAELREGLDCGEVT